MDLKPVLDAVLDEYALPVTGPHGVAHWGRVLENGLRLTRETGADPAVVSLFAVLHDSKRKNELHDPEHGPRAAAFARRLRGSCFELEDRAFRLLFVACEGHTTVRTHPNITIQTCWDADRLDLGRVGVTPHPSRLCTDAARRPDILGWAHGRASFRVIPDWIVEQWSVDLNGPNSGEAGA